MQCFHDSAGPPLHTILFDIEADENKHGVYAQHTLDGFEHVLTEFEGLNLHDTVAIVVADDAFRAAFATRLSPEAVAPVRPGQARLRGATHAANRPSDEIGRKQMSGQWKIPPITCTQLLTSFVIT